MKNVIQIKVVGEKIRMSKRDWSKTDYDIIEVEYDDIDDLIEALKDAKIKINKELKK